MKNLFVTICCVVCAVCSARAQLFSDNFSHTGILSPWGTNAGGGNWSVTGGVMKGGLNPATSYGFTFITNNFTNFSAQADFQFPANAFGGGLGGRLNSASGTHYAVWLYPENTVGDSNVLKLIRFDSYTTFTVLQTTNLAAVGTNNHTIQIEFAGSTINGYLDGVKRLSATDANYASGTISLDFWSDAVPYQMTVDNVVVNSPVLTANADGYTAVLGIPLSVSAPGVLANDTGGNGPLTATLLTNAAHGTLTFNSNGSFTYNATNNFTGTDTFVYRASDGIVTSNATVTLTVQPNHQPVANNDSYAVLQNTTLSVLAPGVIANDTDSDGNSLTAAVVSNPANGTLTLTNNGGFTYIPTTGFAGTDSFTYRVNDGLTNSANATVTISVLSITPLFTDSFTRTSLTPWIAQVGNWGVTNNALRGGTNTTLSYGVASITNVFTNYSVQANVQFPAGAFGGGIDACLNPVTGSRYSAWIYPEGSSGGALTVKLIKFQTYTSFAYNNANSLPIQSAGLVSVGTNAHTLKIACAGSRVAVFVDGVLKISETDIDSGGAPYTNGTIGVDFWTDATGYQMSADDVLVASLVNGDSYSTLLNTAVTANAPGVLANDTEIYGSSLTASLLTSPANGNLTFNSDGSFTYTPTNNFSGTDSFTYQAIDGVAVIGSATVNITVSPAGFPESFDTVTAPALPGGWTSSATGAEIAWVTRTGTTDSAPNAAYVPDPAATGTSELVSPSVTLLPSQTRLSFRNNYNLEADASGRYDGGVLEIKIGAGSFTDIITAGGSFVSGGYNGALSAGSALAGRQAWSSNSVGYITTLVNLPPAAAGQSVQFKWRCATDSSNGNTVTNGWYVDTVFLTSNSPPVLPPAINGTNFTILEGASITVSNTATDADNAANTLSYTLNVTNHLGAAVTNASISASGVITWTTTEAQGPSTNSFTTRVTDGVATVSNVFTVIVNESNSPPVLPSQNSRIVSPNTTVLVTNTATDPDLPANTLTYTLVSPPSFATINAASGVITLSPTLANLNNTYGITTIVSDTNPPAINSKQLSATNTFNVTVSSGPVLSLSSSQLVLEGCLPTNNVIDSGETVTLMFSLTNSGSANTTNLVVTLLETNGVAAPSGPQSYGVVVTGGASVAQAFTLTATGSCGTVLSPTLQLMDGSTSLGTLSTSFTIGQIKSLIIFTQNFDAVTVPALPSGWTTIPAAGNLRWYSTNATVDTAPNAVFSTETNNVGTNELVSPAIVLPTGPVTLSFRHSYSLEADNVAANTGYDGGVLEIKIGAGAYTDITNAGGVFVTGGYNRQISGSFSNPLSGRGAWSGTNGGFTTVTVTLPGSASGQTVQLRWRLGTDNGGLSGTGWRIDSIGMIGNGYVCCTNTAPVLLAQTNRTVNELSTLTVTNAATDAEAPPQVLSYTLTVALSNAPATLATNATISTNGVITWTPTETQGPGVYLVTTIAADNANPALRATNSFYVTVNEVNSAPALTLPPTQTINELALWTTNATAVDTDSPPNTLTFELVSGPSGLTVSPAGLISWTPSEAQGPGSNNVTVRVFDGGTPSLSSTNSFSVIVNEVNSAPKLTLPANQTVNELALWTGNATAVDTDSPPNTVTFELVSGPGGLTVSPAGLISWTPSEAQGPGTYPVTVRVFDNGAPSMSDTNSFNITVNEVNSAPALTVPASQTIDELALWTANATAVDTDSPPNTVTFELVSGPSGLSVSPAGLITWTPAESQGPSTNTVTVRVFDNGSPSLSATNSFTLTVGEVNTAPELTLPASQTIDELALWTANATAIDTDSPPNSLTFALVSGPSGLTVDTNGVITWTPSESQGPSTNTITVRVFDNGSPSLSVTNSFTLTVNEVNSAPALTLPGNQTIDELALWTANATASDTDSPPNSLTFELVSGPGGLTVSPAGLISWTPTEAQGPSTNTVTVRVFDDGSPSLAVTNSFTVTVNEANSAPALTLPASQTIDELALWTANASATDTDSPPNSLTFELVSGPSGLTVDSAGLISWTPTEAQGPGTNTVTVRVFDNGTPSLSSTNSFTLTVREINSAPALTVPTNAIIDAQALWTANATAIDTDLPPNTLTFELVSGPSGLTVSPAGLVSWNPTSGQADTTNTVSVRVFDDGIPVLAVTNSFVVTVNPQTTPSQPTIQGISLSNDVVIITWSSISNRSYMLQRNDDLLTTNWVDMPPAVPATGPTATATDSVNSVTQRLYRIHLVP